MKRRFWWGMAQLGVLVVALSMGALAQGSQSTRFSGLLNDYSPASVSGPWEVRGEWSLQLNGNSGKAQFSAVLTMERSDEGVLLNGGGDFETGAGRHAHTHHITLRDATVTALPNGFRVTGTASVAGNGNPPPNFDISSPITVDITGGSIVPYANIHLSFGAPASSHFGSLAFSGVVQNVKQDD